MRRGRLHLSVAPASWTTAVPAHWWWFPYQILVGGKPRLLLQEAVYQRKSVLEDAPAPSLKEIPRSTSQTRTALMRLTVPHIGAVGYCKAQKGRKSRIGTMESSSHRLAGV